MIRTRWLQVPTGSGTSSPVYEAQHPPLKPGSCHPKTLPFSCMVHRGVFAFSSTPNISEANVQYFPQFLSYFWSLRLTDEAGQPVSLRDPPVSTSPVLYNPRDYKLSSSHSAVYLSSGDQTLVLKLVQQALDWLKYPPHPHNTVLYFSFCKSTCSWYGFICLKSKVTFLSQVSTHLSYTCGISIYMLHVITGML